MATIAQNLNGSEIGRFAQANNRTHRVVSKIHYSPELSHSLSAFSANQYALIRRFNSTYNASQPLSVRDLNTIREIFNGTEKFMGAGEKMVQRMKIVMPEFATSQSCKDAIENDDVYKVKVHADYFGFNTNNWWTYLRTSISKQSKVFRLYQNSDTLLQMQHNGTNVEEFISYYKSVRELVSLNIFYKIGNGPSKYFLDNTREVTRNDIQIYRFILDQGSEFDVNMIINDGARLSISLIDGDASFTVAKLLKQYAFVDVNKQTGYGHTTLMNLRLFQKEQIDILLSWPGIDVNLQNKAGLSALYN